uniref:Uncharacterized protein n=1 Tax=Arundo donax TaxID=35708 RepID=A0A0A9GWI7_ARUDO
MTKYSLFPERARELRVITIR